MSVRVKCRGLAKDQKDRKTQGCDNQEHMKIHENRETQGNKKTQGYMEKYTGKQGEKRAALHT